MNAEYPILEFDPSRRAMIEPRPEKETPDVPEHCVLCFFSDVVRKVVNEQSARIAVPNRWEDGAHPLYEIEYGGKRVAFFQPGIGAPFSAGLLEEAIGFGCRKFIACGGAGVLEADIAVGHLVVVNAAVRDEGTSYHYLPAAREITAQPGGVAALERVLGRRGLPYRLAKTWTTDAPYRETPARVAARRGEGCAVVEMEASALMAVAQFRGVSFGQVLYGGDDLSGEVWDNRGWQSRAEVRENLFWLAVEAVLEL